MTIATNTPRPGESEQQKVARRDRRQSPVRFVSSRLGIESVPRETKHERDAEYRAVAVALKQFGGAGE